MKRFKGKVKVCLEKNTLKFDIELKSLNDVKITYNHHITYVKDELRHFVFFIETEDGSRITTKGTHEKNLHIPIINKDVKIDDLIGIKFLNDNELFSSIKKSNKITDAEPLEAGNGGVVGVTGCN